MNPIADHIRAHLTATGKSMRALSMEIGQGEKFVADILCGKSKRPTPAALEKLSAVIGVDLAALPVQRQVTAAEMETDASGAAAGRLEHLESIGRAIGPRLFCSGVRRRWSASDDPGSVEGPCLAEQHDSGHPGNGREHLRHLFESSARYVRHRCRDRAPAGDPGRLWALACPLRRHQEVGREGLRGGSRPERFCAWCDGIGLAIADIRPETFTDYLAARLASGKVTMDKSKHRDTAMEALALWNRLAEGEAFRAMGVRAVVSPFTDGRDRYGMPNELLAPLLAEFDDRVLPWARGETGPDGTPVDMILDRLEPVEVENVDHRKRKLQAYLGKQTRVRRQGREDRLRAAGVLLGDACWKSNTADNARAAIKSLAMALWSQTRNRHHLDRGADRPGSARGGSHRPR